MLKNDFRGLVRNVYFECAGGVRPYIWTAEDLNTHEVIKAKSARKLGELIGVYEWDVLKARKEDKLAAKRYKITRKKAQ